MSKVFDDFPVTDCNQCSNWWDDSCEGVKKGSEKVCTAFKAQRNVVIPEQIEYLASAIKGLIFGVVVLGVWNAFLTVVLMFTIL